MSSISWKDVRRVFTFLLVGTVPTILGGCAEIAGEFGKAIGEELSPMILYPLVVCGICWWMSAKILPGSSFVFPVGLIGGQIVMEFISSLYKADTSVLFLSVLVLAGIGAGILWLVKWPGFSPVALLTTWEVINGYYRIQVLSTGAAKIQLVALIL